LTIKQAGKNLLNEILKRHGHEILASHMVYDWQRTHYTQPTYNRSVLPEGAASYLHRDHPRLKELQSRYRHFTDEVTAPLVWREGYVRDEDILYFRGDNAYVWQLKGQNMNVMSYALTAFYVKAIDGLGLLETLREDDFFGNFTFNIDKKVISRDLLDSIIEIYFLEKHLNTSSSRNLTLLDIGAGYGRLAHRMLSALPSVRSYLCADAIAVSTFISEYYIRHRDLADRARAIPLDEVEETLRKQAVDIALNIHSFSECSISAIEWWLSLVEKYGVKHLMVVPNTPDPSGNLLLTNDRKDFGRVIEKHGYKLIAKEPKYRDPIVQKYAINPTYHYLFELR